MNDKIKITSLQVQSDALLKASIVVRTISKLVIQRRIDEAAALRKYYKTEVEPEVMGIINPQKN